ncbi:hypothetical protein ACJX0J_038850, partial [Zea mays]
MLLDPFLCLVVDVFLTTIFFSLELNHLVNFQVNREELNHFLIYKNLQMLKVALPCYSKLWFFCAVIFGGFLVPRIEEEARQKIYSVSTRHYFGFGALVSEELSYKLKEIPKVRWVLPDSYLDVKNKDYG